jgi:MFS family permease
MIVQQSNFEWIMTGREDKSVNNRIQSWLNVAACGVITMMALGLVSHAGTLYIDPVTRDMGFSRAEFNVVFTVSSITGMGISLSMGRVYRMVKRVRGLLLIGIISACLCQFIFSKATTITFFYLGGIFMGGAIFYLGSTPYAILTADWFHQKRTTAYGIILAGSGIGGVVFSPLTSYWILHYGWRTSYLIASGLLLLICLPMLLIIRDKPAPDPDEVRADEPISTNQIQPAAIIKVPGGYTLKEAAKTKAFWLAAPGFFLMALTIFSVYINMAAHLVNLQLIPQVVAWVLSVIFMVNTVAKLLLGVMTDRIGIRPVFLFSNICYLLATALLLRAGNPLIAFAAAIFFGFGFATMSVPIPELVRHLFGMKDFSTLLGVFMMFLGMGGAVGPVIGGVLFDRFGSYHILLMLALVLNTLSVLLVLASLKQSQKTAAGESAAVE